MDNEHPNHPTNGESESPPAIIARPTPGNSIQRQGFASSEMEFVRETQATAVAERAKREIEALYVMAMKRPRNVLDVRERMLQHCKRKGFAMLAEYAKPVGNKTIRGPSIRFVEAALQEFGNVAPQDLVTYDDDEKRISCVSVTDLERNVTYRADVTVEKYVERKNPRQGDEVIGSRMNSYNEMVYRIRAHEDDFANKHSAAVSKKLRTLGLRILPSDLVEEWMSQCRKTRDMDVAADPSAARKQIADAFAGIGVMPSALEDYLDHGLDASSPAELDELRAMWAAIRDGEARWVDLMESKRAERGEVDKPSKKANEAADRVKAKLAEKKAAPNGNGKVEPKPEAKTDAKPDPKTGTQESGG